MEMKTVTIKNLTNSNAGEALKTTVLVGKEEEAATEHLIGRRVSRQLVELVEDSDR